MIDQTSNVKSHEDPHLGTDVADQYAQVAEVVCERLAANQRVRRNLPDGGRIRIDRQLPFLCVYRHPPEQSGDGARELITTEASYLFASGDPQHHDGLVMLCKKIMAAMREHFGTFLLIEVWEQPPDVHSIDDRILFEIISADCDSIPSTIQTMCSALEKISIKRQSAEVVVRQNKPVCPPGLSSLNLDCTDPQSAGCCSIGLTVNPIYRDSSSQVLFPMVLQALRRQLTIAIRRTVAQFTGSRTDGEGSINSAAYHEFGPSTLVKAARLVDQQLSDISESFDFLLPVTPTNTSEAEQSFQNSGCECAPNLNYRPLPYHPNLLKRQLFGIEIERIEDPTLAHLCWEKQEELDRKLTALRGYPETEVL
ncbi:hypothetical protein KOR42_48850 [Thalassoglobus neptunius]|uniref:Uncharacterized protein n=1 Tax=Thalassoglobus neptunius TaxID=1938619 RepID=A0A5C5VRC1_9PLAN|nr:DUF1704 domain-containing protein [Thalassoglobus neptunius]TWT40710.1 hypothetical protein KOR42_48850 [Thalassoglobus neptunius]